MPRVIPNYLHDASRSTPLNLAIFRIVIGAYLIWRMVYHDLVGVAVWPEYVYADSKRAILLSEHIYNVLPALGALIIMLSLLFIVGYHLRITAFLLTVAIGVLTTHIHAINSSGHVQALFIAMYFVLFIGLYAEQDILSIDGLRRLEDDELRDRLDAPQDHQYSLDALKWSFVIIAILYFGAAWGKIVNGPVTAWIQPDTLPRFVINQNHIMNFEPPRLAAEPLFVSEALSIASAVGTITIQAGLLIALIAGLPLSIFVIGLLGMHALAALSIGPFFISNMIFLTLFIAWDSGVKALNYDQSVTVFYDNSHSTCVHGLYLYQFLTNTDAIKFVPISDAAAKKLPCKYKDDSATMIVDCEGSAFVGTQAVTELLNQNRVLVPIATVLQFRPVASATEVLYDTYTRTRKSE